MILDSAFIGDGEPGGKASGLISLEKLLSEADEEHQLAMPVSVPDFKVITAEFFSDFVTRNDLEHYADTEESDQRIAMAFLHGEISPRLSGILWKFISGVHEPLAVRSSSLLEDALQSPLAGIYQTKMIPNNQPSAEVRFRKLMEAVKLVWASTYFKDSREFHKGIDIDTSREKMAVILQHISGRRYGDRFYPVVSGVARSYNYYAFGASRPEDGVVNLALGLGKTIVDGGSVWSYCPEKPRTPPPFGSTSDMIRETQSSFWAVNMSGRIEYDPVRETEFMVSCPLKDADYDNTLRLVASTYVPASDMLVHGTGRDGPRILNFAPILLDKVMPLNEAVRFLLKLCESGTGSPVEIEFAVTGPAGGGTGSLDLLQMRETAAPDSSLELNEEDMHGEKVVVRSKRALGNGEYCFDHVLYVRPDRFDKSRTGQIAGEIATINRKLHGTGEKYLLIGFGRWGSSDPWLGIPVTWGGISGAGAIVEVASRAMRVELSQGSHFFHNLSSFGIAYLSVNEPLDGELGWSRLEEAGKTVHETEHLRCLRIPGGIRVRIDGRKGFGVVEI